MLLIYDSSGGKWCSTPFWFFSFTDTVAFRDDSIPYSTIADTISHDRTRTWTRWHQSRNMHVHVKVSEWLSFWIWVNVHSFKFPEVSLIFAVFLKFPEFSLSGKSKTDFPGLPWFPESLGILHWPTRCMASVCGDMASIKSQKLLLMYSLSQLPSFTLVTWDLLTLVKFKSGSDPLSWSHENI